MKSKEEIIDEDIEALNKYFPKGDKRRGEAMLILSLARIRGAKEVLNKNEK